MASSNKTTNLQLNQWIATDQVLRSDLNIDNIRIDSAVNLRPLVRMESKKLTAAANVIIFDYSYYVLSDYIKIQLYLYPVVSGVTTTTITLNETSAYSLCAPDVNGTTAFVVDLYLTPGGIVGEWIAAGSSETGRFICTEITASTLNKITFTCSSDGSYKYQSGTVARSYGIYEP